ncbi:hypothetical protein [Streptomyces sp. SM10]|nr:hypothetical protein [Streptomyces sp. SM10]
MHSLGSRPHPAYAPARVIIRLTVEATLRRDVAGTEAPGFRTVVAW